MDLPGRQLALREPDYGAAGAAQVIGKSLAGMGAMADNAIDAGRAREAKDKQEAEALSEADKMLQFQERATRRLQGDSSSTGRIDDAFDGIDTSKGGFLATRGFKASEQSADVVDGLVKDAKDIAATISDPMARQRFELKARESLLAYRKQVETHTSRQLDVAREDTLKGLMAQAISQASTGVTDFDVTDFDVWRTASKNAVDSIEANASSPDAAKGQVAAFHAENSFAFVQGLVAQGRTEDAATFVKEQRAYLGTRFDDASKLVAGGMAKLEARHTVESAFSGATNEDGFVDEAKVLGAFDELPLEQQQNAGPLLKRELAGAAQRKAATVKGWKNEASGQLNKGGFASIDVALTEKLNKYEPDYLRRLRNEDELRQRRARAKASGRHDGKSERANDKLWITRFKALGTQGMNETEVSDFAMGHGLSEQGMADLELLKTRAGESMGKAENRVRDTMQDDGEKALRALPRKKGEKTPIGLTEDDVADFRADVFDAYENFVTQHKRAPDAEERSKLISELLVKTKVEVPGRFWGTNTIEKRAFQVAPTGPLPPKDQQALDWANSNPNDPRAAAIKKRLQR